MLKQRDALLALLPLEPVEQALGGEVDRLGAHLLAQRTPCRSTRAGRQASGDGRRITQAMIVLGIDPGLANTGYGVVAPPRRAPGGARRRRDRDARASTPHERRLADIHAAGRQLIDEHEPDAVALEELYFGQNVRTAFAVGHARGVVMLAAGQRGLPCAGYTPQQVKGAVCGNGRAAKDQVARMVQALLGLEHEPRPDHAADALAVAICHANCAPLSSALAKAGA